VSISSIIRQLRVLNAAAKETRNVEQWEQLRRKHEFVAYEDLGGTESASDSQEMHFIKTVPIQSN